MRGNLTWYALFVIASIVGGLAAAAIEHESSLEAAGLSLIVAAAAAFALYAGLLVSAQRRAMAMKDDDVTLMRIRLLRRPVSTVVVCL